MRYGMLKLALATIACLSAYSFAQLPTIKVTTKNNQEVNTTCTGMQMMGMCMGTQSMNYYSITNFELNDPNDSRNNINLTPEPQGESDSIRVRGNSTANNNKKPYRIKFDKKQGLFGKTAAKSWVLLANFYDHTFILNAMAFELGKRLGLAFTPTYRYVDVYINNSYKGVYQLTEQIQVNPGRVDIDNTRGWLVEFDYHDAEADQIKFNAAGGNLSMATRIRSPEVESNFTVNNPAISFVVSEVNALFNAMAANGFPTNGYRDLLDLESWVRYVLIQRFMDNFDFNNKAMASGTAVNGSNVAEPGSNYAYKDNGARIHAGPLWDFDLAAGVHPTTSFPKHYTDTDATRTGIKPMHPFYIKLWDDPVFIVKLKKIWSNYKCHFEAMPAIMDSLGNVLKGRAQANFAAYSGGSNDTRPNNESSYLGEITKLKNWWNSRITSINTQINALSANASDVMQSGSDGNNHAANCLGTSPIMLPQIASSNAISTVKNGIELQAEKTARIEVYNLGGKLEKTMNFASGVHSVSLNDMPKGMYIVRVSFGTEKRILRLPVR